MKIITRKNILSIRNRQLPTYNWKEKTEISETYIRKEALAFRSHRKYWLSSKGEIAVD